MCTFQDKKLKVAEDSVGPLKKKREEDRRSILDLNHSVDTREKQLKKMVNERNELVSDYNITLSCFMLVSTFVFFFYQKVERDRLKKELDSERSALIQRKAADKRVNNH